MAQDQAKFLEGSLLGHITTMSVTASLGFLALFIVDAVDMLFISMLGVPELAAAVGFAGTILFFSTSISIGISIAAGALIARALGEGKTNRAREVMTHTLMLGALLTSIIAVLMWTYAGALAALLGASSETAELTVSYLRIILPTMPLLMAGMVGAAALRSHGAARLSMMATMAAGGVNAVLDPIFIFGLDLGLDGAAYASACSRVAMVVVALWPIFKRFGGLSSLAISKLIPDIRPIAAIAIPAMLANVATPVGSAYVTRMAAEFGEEAVAGMAIIGRVTPIAFALIFALSGAIGPIIGQNFGAKKFDRVREAFRDSLIFITVYVFGVVIVLFALRGVIADIFSATGIARDLIFLFAGPLSLAWIFNGIIFVGNAAYNNLGHPFYSTWINWGRNTLGVIPFVWIGAEWYGALGVLAGQMAGGVVVALISLALSYYTIRKAEELDGLEAQKPAFGQHRRAFSIANHRR